MKFRALVLELHLPQNFCHTHIDRQTFSRNSQIVFRTSQNVQIHQNPEIENLHETNTFFCLHRRKYTDKKDVLKNENMHKLIFSK